MIVVHTFQVRPNDKERANTELRKAKAVFERHGGRHLRYYGSTTSGAPNRMFIYEIDPFAHFDRPTQDPDFRAVRLGSLYSDATGTTWGEVPL